MKEAEYVRFRKEASRVLYWTTLLVMTICNLIVALIVLPMLLALKGMFVILVIFVLGLIFGLIFNHLIRDITHLERRHHFFAAVFIPAMAVIDLFAAVNVANRIASLIQLPVHQDPFTITMMFVIGFMVPYVTAALGKRR